VVSDKMDKTRVVLVERRFSHLKYGKFLTGGRSTRRTTRRTSSRPAIAWCIMESRPLSREKRWTVIELLERPQEA
jgi:small subunit ribosomal protein S17